MIVGSDQLKRVSGWFTAGSLLAASTMVMSAQTLTKDDLERIRVALLSKNDVLRTYSADATAEYVFQNGSLSALPVNARLLTTFRAERVSQKGRVLSIAGTRKLYVQVAGTQKLLPTQVERPAAISIELKSNVDLSTLLKILPEQVFFQSVQEAVDALPSDRRNCILQQYDEASKSLVPQSDCTAKAESITTKPTLLKQKDPEFPEGIRGTFFVVLSMIVGEAGKPYNIRVEKSDLKALDASALAAISQYRFQPALINGKPVPFQLTIQVKFERF